MKRFLALISLLFVANLRADIAISEIMAAGQDVVADEDGAHPDWIEIVNNGPIGSLAGWHLSDDPDKPKKWAFPAITVITGYRFVVFASGKDRLAPKYHTNFHLRAGGETLILTRPDGSVAQIFVYPVQVPDLSWDGTNFLGTPTPGETNALNIVRIAASPDFSKPRGLQAKAFDLSLTPPSDEAEIYYTLDGSEPTTASKRYTAPIRISRTSVVRSFAQVPGYLPSPSVARTFVFIGDVLQQSPGGKAPAGWPKTWGENAVDYGMDARIARQAPHAAKTRTALGAIPSFSVVMDLEDMFGANGVYAHPNFRGEEWERPMSLEYFDPADGQGFQINGGIRIRGGASRDPGNVKHSLQFRFRKTYGAPELKFPLFGADGPQRMDRFDLRWDHLVSWHYGQNADANQLQDAFGRATQLAAGSPAKRGHLVHLYLNGQYWGLYFIDQRVSPSFGAEQFGGSDEDYEVVRYDNEADGGTGFQGGSFAAWRRLHDICAAGLVDNAPYFRVQGLNPDGSRNPAFERLIDVDNLIDYMLIGHWCVAGDNPFSGAGNNWFSIRSRRGDFGFRFFVHDFELSMDSKDTIFFGNEPASNPFESTPAEQSNPWHFFEAMRTNAEFRLRVADRAQRLFFGSGALTTENAVMRWQNLMNEMEPAITAESARWGDAHGGFGFPGPFVGAPIFSNPFNPQIIGFGAPQVIFPPNPIPGTIIGPGPGPQPGSHRRPYTQADWRRGAKAKLDDFVAVRTPIFVNALRNAGMFSQLAAPVVTAAALLKEIRPDGSDSFIFIIHGDGSIPTASFFTLTNPNLAGQIYYTLNGEDPRLIGGAVSSDAKIYQSPAALAAEIASAISIAKNVTLKARVIDGREWSALLEATLKAPVDYSALKLTEIHYNPLPEAGATGDDLEFIELKNTGTTPLDVTGFKFTSGIQFTFPAPVLQILLPGAYFVLARNAAAFEAHYGFAPNGVFTGKLGDDGARLTLVSSIDGQVFSLEYDDNAPWPKAADGLGFSMVYDGKGNPDEGKNWRASSVIGGSPGADDPVPPAIPRVVINEIYGGPVLRPVVSPFIELHNPGDTAVNISGWFLSDDAQFSTRVRIPDGKQVAARGYVSFDPEILGIPISATGGELWLASATPDGVLTGHVHGVRYTTLEPGVSFGRHINSAGEEQFPAQDAITHLSGNSEPRAALPLRITEVHYHPANPAHEFVEIENLSLAAVDLSGVRLAGLAFTFPAGSSLPASGRAIVAVANEAAFREAFTKVPLDVPIFGPATGALQDNGERVAIETADGVVLDALRYNDRAPWPVTAAGRGDSLQRISTAGYGDDPASWLAALPTPGLVNSVNAPPVVTMTSPRDGLVVPAAENVAFAATAGDVDGTVTLVEFLVDGLVVASDTHAPFEYTWRATSGLHDVSARATDNGGAMSESPPVTVIGEGVGGTGIGLRAEYFANPGLDGQPAASAVVPTVDFDWTEIDPANGVSRTGFSARFTGLILPSRVVGHFDGGPPGQNLMVETAGGVRIYVDGRLVLDQWQEPPKEAPQARYDVFVPFIEGVPAPIRIEYFDTDGFALLQLKFSEGFSERIVPQENLFPPGANPNAFAISTPAILPTRRVGQSLRIKLTAVNGTAPYTWRVQEPGGVFQIPILPEGLSLSESGLLSGAPVSPGLYTFAITAIDSPTVRATKTFTIRVLPLPAPALEPRVTILSPAQNAVVTTDPVLVTGQVRGENLAGSLRYSLNGGPWRPMPTLPDWTLTLDKLRGLVGGRNTLRVAATDLELRESKIVQRTFTVRYATKLTVTIQGAGTVTPGFLGTTTRYIGDRHTITATPAPGWVFEQWSPLFVDSPRLTFDVTDNAELTAVFVPSPFTDARGRYSGLLGSGEDGTRGNYSVQLLPDGTFSASFAIGERRMAFSGRFDRFGNYFRPFDPAKFDGINGISLGFRNDAEPAIAANASFFFGDFFAFIEGVATPAKWPTPPQQRGRWTFSLPAPADVTTPRGNGFASGVVRGDGSVRLVGRSGDGAPFTASGWLQNAGPVLPFYAPLTGADWLHGSLDFSALPGGNTLSWNRGGAIGTVDIVGYPYLAPAEGKPAIANVPLEFFATAGKLEQPLSLVARIQPDNSFKFTPANASLAIDPATGIARGTMNHPKLGQVQVRGITLQPENWLRGFFTIPSETGAFEIRRVVALPVAP